jgi:CRP-like cAMP-binding protein
MLPLFEPLKIERGRTLYDVGDPVPYAYFPSSGLMSLVSTTREGQTLELAMVGRDGMLAIETVLQVPTARCQAIAHMSSDVLCIRAERLRTEFEHTAALRRVLLQYTHRLLEQASQSAVCHRYHTVLQRLARWLLVARDRLQSDLIQLTQESVANLLASPRSAVTTASVILQDRGAIRQRHGRTVIVDAARLREAACECYVAPSTSARIHLGEPRRNPTRAIALTGRAATIGAPQGGGRTQE